MKTRRCPSFSRRFVRQMSCVAGESMKNRWAGKEAALGATRQTAAPSVIDLLNWEQRVACVSCGAPGTDRKQKMFYCFLFKRWTCSARWRWKMNLRQVSEFFPLKTKEMKMKRKWWTTCDWHDGVVERRWTETFRNNQFPCCFSLEEAVPRVGDWRKKESNNKAEASATWVCREICPLVDEINLETFFFPCYPDRPILLRNIGVYGRRVSIFTSCITAAYLSCVLS